MGLFDMSGIILNIYIFFICAHAIIICIICRLEEREGGILLWGYSSPFKTMQGTHRWTLTPNDICGSGRHQLWEHS